ncbi:MAG: hypothetical protein ACLFPA_07530 [Dichotomicrobium sp.]
MVMSHVADQQPLTGTRQGDPFAPEAFTDAETPLERFLALLALVDRTVLPRAINVESAAMSFSLDTGKQRLSLLPRHQTSYATDQILSAEAPRVYRTLNKKAQSARKAMDSMMPARDAILRCAARALWEFAGTGPAQHRIHVASEDDVGGIGFSALELYAATREQVAPAGEGPVSAFYALMKPRALAAWHAARSGWVHDWSQGGDSRQSLRALADIFQTARGFGAWIDATGTGDGASLTFLSGTGHKVIRCVVADDTDIAHLALSPTAWAGALRNWDAIRADPAFATRASTPSDETRQ